MFYKKKVFLNFANFTGKQLCQCQPETLAQALSLEFCKIFKSTYFIEHMRRTAFIKFCVE